MGQGRSALPPLWWALGVPGGDGGRQPPEGPKPKAGPGGAGKGSGQPQRRGLGEDAYHQEAREAAGGAKRTVPCLGGWAVPPQRPSWPCRSRASPGCGLSRDLAVRVTLVKHTLVGDSLYLKHGVGGQLRVGTAGGESARPTPTCWGSRSTRSCTSRRCASASSRHRVRPSRHRCSATSHSFCV